MPTAWRYRLFRVGRMPAELKAAADRPETLVAAEGVSVRCSGRSVRLPGLRSARSVRLLVGSVVLSRDRLLLAIGRYPILDTDLAGDGPAGQTVELSAEGIQVHVEDIASMVPQGSGTMDLRFRTPIADTVLTGLPSGRGRQSFSDAAAVMMRGWL